MESLTTRGQYNFARFARTTRPFALILSLLTFAFTGAAQNSTSNALPTIQTTSQQAPAKAASETSSSNTKSDTRNPVDDYKKSLSDLSALYEKDVQRLEQENSKLKELYSDGIIARVELEKSDKSVADARAKIEEIRNQITAANKPPVASSTFSVPLVASNQTWTTGNAKVDLLIRYYGNTYKVDPYLVFCVMSQESRFGSNAISPKGALGLMQLMPGTAARYGVTNPYDMAQSIMGGTHYLKDLLQLFNGRIDLALAGYNAGENTVIKYGYSVPPYSETRNYVRLISARYTNGKKTGPLTVPGR